MDIVSRVSIWGKNIGYKRILFKVTVLCAKRYQLTRKVPITDEHVFAGRPTTNGNLL